MFKVNNRNARARCEICSNLTINKPEYFTPCSRVSIVNFEKVNAGWVCSVFKIFMLLYF